MAARAIASCTRRTGASTMRESSRLRSRQHEHERERDAPVDEPARDRLAALERREALQQVQPPVRLARRREGRHEGQHPLAAEARLAELVLPGRGPPPAGSASSRRTLAAGEERPAARAHEVGLAVPVHEQDDARAARGSGSRVRRPASRRMTPRRRSRRGRGRRPRSAPTGSPPAPRGRRGAAASDSRLLLELVVDELALVVAAQRREQPLVLLEQPLALGGEHRREHERGARRG